MKNYPIELREKFDALAEQLCVSSITLGELHDGAEQEAVNIRFDQDQWPACPATIE
nr:hypothetical protein [Bradyrhizobium valentinum]